MKKFSSLVLIFVCLISVCLFGCGGLNLTQIEDKYKNLVNNNEEIFVNNSFAPVYYRNLLAAVNSVDHFKVLAGEYQILASGISSTIKYNNAFKVQENNGKVNYNYKEEMNSSLNDLENSLTKLKQGKISLQNLFDNDSRDAIVVANQEITILNLNKHKEDLSNALKDFYNFNKAYSKALNENIIKPISLETLLYNLPTGYAVSLSEYNLLANNLNLLLSNYVLTYSIGVKNDISSSSEIINNISALLQAREQLSSGAVSKVYEYKNLRAMEDSLLKGEKAFVAACENLGDTAFTNPTVLESISLETVNNYCKELINYSNKLIEFLQNV